MVTGFGTNRPDGQPRASRVDLSISAERGTGQHKLIVSMSGELDAFNAQSLFDVVSGLELDGQRAVTLDLSGLTFCDAGGVSAVLRADRFLHDRGGRLKIRGVSGLPRRVFTLAGIDKVIEVD
jgi:anti-sigma B factor antagonist